MTREKNRIHHALEGCGIKLSSVLSDIFGRSGQYILNSLLKGIDIEDIIEGIPVKRIKKNREMYLDEVVKKIKLADIDRPSLTELSLEEMIGLFSQSRLRSAKRIRGFRGIRPPDLVLDMFYMGEGVRGGNCHQKRRAQSIGGDCISPRGRLGNSGNG